MTVVLFAISHSGPGGAQSIWADLAKVLRQRGYDARLAALYPGKDGTLEVDAPGWTYCLQSPPRAPLDGLHAIHGAKRLIGDLAPDVIITALPAANVVFPLAALRQSTRAKVFVSHHTPVSTYRAAFRMFDGLVSASGAVDGVVCVSAAVGQSLDQYPRPVRRKIKVITNALPLEVEALTRTLRYGSRPDHARARLVASGRLAAQKNYPVLLHAMKLVTDAECEIIGSGPDEAELKGLAERLGVASYVTFAGLRGREETLKNVAEADMFVQPSLFEGHSLALIEAAKLGRPLIVSDVPSQVQAVTRSDGMLCAMVHPVHDPVALADRIRTMAGDARTSGHYAHLSKTLGDEIQFDRMVDAYEKLWR